MSSLGNQWRVIRHYLSAVNVNSEIEKLIQKIKPVTPEQWENLLKKFEASVLAKLKDTQPASQHVVKASSVDTTQGISVQKEAETKEAGKPKEEVPEKREAKPSEGVGSDMSFAGLMEGLKLTKNLHFGKISEPSWKANKPIVTTTSIHSRTAYVVSSLLTADSVASLRRRALHCVDHLLHYPEARDYAIKEGAVRALLRAQRHLKDDVPEEQEVKGIINEALALVGVVGLLSGDGPLRAGGGPRILSLDGGGVRGLAAVRMLRALETAADRPVHQLFDYIVGVSTGAIIAAVIGSGRGNLETADDMYLNLSKKMFGNTSLIGGTSRLVWSQSYYDTSAWEELLKQNLGDLTMSQINRKFSPQLALVSCVQWGGRLCPFVFRSYSPRYRARALHPGSSGAALWQAVRASAAAPTYFSEARLHGLLHQDGGIVVNNPAGVAVHEARLLFGPAAMQRAVLVSVGTGRAPRTPHPARTRLDHRDHREPQASSWRDKFNRILDSATDTEGVHQLLSDVLPLGGYFRLNPPLLQALPMDEADPARLRDLQRDTDDYCRRNQHKIAQAARRLTQPPPLARRVAARLKHQAVLLGAMQTH